MFISNTPEIIFTLIKLVQLLNYLRIKQKSLVFLFLKINKYAMKRNYSNYFLLLSAFLLLFLSGCFKNDKSNRPTIITSTVTEITSNSATSGGVITNDQGEIIIEQGVCWDIQAHPTILNNTTSNSISTGTNIGSFTSEITGLSPNTRYYVRAYATVRHSETDPYTGTGYGNEMTFVTLP